MKVLILGALEKEISVLVDLVKAKKKDAFFYQKMGMNEVYIAVTGVGIINALTSTYSLIERIHPDIVINIGTAGAHTLDINDGDIVVCDEAIYHGGYIMESSSTSTWEVIDATNLVMKGDEYLSKLLERVSINSVIHHGSTLSGDFFTKDVDTINSLRNKYHHLCEDMETIAIYKACNEKKIPCIAYRIISNNELKGSKYEDNVLQVNNKLQTIVFELLKSL